MNKIIMPPDRVKKQIRKRIDHKEQIRIKKAIIDYLQESDPCKPVGRRIDSYKNQYIIPEYRLRVGNYRVFYNVEEGFLNDTVYVLDIIPKHMNEVWLKNHGVKK